MERIYVDFNTMNQDLWSKDRRVRINRGKIEPGFREGLRVLISDEDLAVEATLEFDREHNTWWARPDWSTRQDLSDVAVLAHTPREIP